ncbi:MAG TPA: HdeD family acid-resistance protein [Pirellulales bacterium]|nr:HdeD family acid-resistance protein [Pirellulales bacterium]
MSSDLQTPFSHPVFGAVRDELQRLRHHGVWFIVLGVLLVVAGTAAIVVPAVTVGTTFAATIFLGVLLMVAGVATIINSFWVGQWSGFFLNLLVGILYLAAGFIMTENPVVSAVTLTVFIAVSWIVLGVFRIVSALTIRFGQWGWALLSGAITTIAGVVIYRHLPFDAAWVIGLLVGLEMLFNGWTWIMLGTALRRIPKAST